MRKLLLNDYQVEAKNEKGELAEVPYQVKRSLVAVLFAPELRLDAVELLERDKLANKINDAIDGYVLLEDAEYSKLESAIKTVRGLGRNEVELVKRILGAEKVEVTEKEGR